jgi:anti-sigma factor RsiW
MKNKCEPYGLAITDYVLGEKMDISQAELVKHLRACARCREDLKEWQATYTVMRAKEYDDRPEVKARYEALIKELTRRPVDFVPQGVPLNMAHEIGSPAGKVWQALASNGVIRMEELPQKTGLEPALAWGAMGWLAHENKLCMTKHEDHYDLYLPAAERQNHQPRA